MAQDTKQLFTKLHNYVQSHSIPGGTTTNLDPITYNPRYAGFDETNYRKLESKIDALWLTGSDKEKAMDELYLKALPIVQNEIKNSDRRKYINNASYEVSQIQDKDARMMARGKLTVTELAQQVKEKFNLDPTAPDEWVFNDWINQIPNWEQLLVNYLNNWDRELLYQWGLETPMGTPETPDSSVWGMQEVINKQSEMSNVTRLGKASNAVDKLNIVWRLTTLVDGLTQKIPVVTFHKQVENLASKMNNLSEDELSSLYNRYQAMVKNWTDKKWQKDDRNAYELIWDWLMWDQDALDRVNSLYLADYSEAMPQDWVERNQWGNQLLWGLNTEEKEWDNLIVQGAKKLTNLNKNLLNFIGWSWWGLENYAEALWVGIQKMKDINQDRTYAPLNLENDKDAFQAFVANQTANFWEHLVDAPETLMGANNPNFAKMVVNAPWSFLKTISAKVRWATNPLDTKIWLLKTFFTEDGQQAMINRYGTVDAIANTMNTDPVWLASDIVDWWDKLNWVFNKATWWAVERRDIRDVTDAISSKTAWGINQGLNFVSDWFDNRWYNKTAGLVNITRDAAFNPSRVAWDVVGEAEMVVRDMWDVPGKVQEWLREWANRVVQNINRMTKKQQEKFRQMSGGIEQWEFQNKRWLKTLDDLADHLTKNLDQVDEAMETIEWRFKSKQLDKVINDVVEYATDTEDKQAGRLQKLARKNTEWWLTMPEINEIKRFYERTTIFDYLKDKSNSKKARTATNRDTALREWQQQVAEEAGLDNLKELNKETQLTKYILDNASDWQSGVKGNNPITLTDWIVAAGGGLNIKWIESLVGKKIYQSTWFQNWLVDVLNYLWGREIEEWPTVDMEKIQQSNVNRAMLAEELSRVQNEKQFNAWLEKARDMNPALPYDSRYDNQEPIDYTSPTRVTPGGQAIRAGQISEVWDVPANYKTPNDTTDTKSDLYTKQSPSRIKVMEDAIIDEYGTTNNPSQAAFVDNEGRWINWNWRKKGNFRDIDHRDYAYTAFWEDNMESFKNATDWLNALQAQMGLVRVNYDDWRLDIDTVYKLTPDQIEWIERFADGKISEVNVDITNATDWTILNSDTFDNVRDALRFINKNFIDNSEK